MKTSLPTKDQLSLLYSSGKSMADIAGILRCSVHKVVYWMQKYNIEKRSRSEALYVKLNPHGDPFTIKDDLLKNDSFLYGLGLGIYWGEGEKVSNGKVRVANTDAHLLRSFREFLITICQVTVSRIHYSIICFNDSDPKEALRYWSAILEISDKQFGKIVQIAPQGKGTYQKKSKYGVCILEVSNTKLKQWIMKELHNIYIADIV